MAYTIAVDGAIEALIRSPTISSNHPMSTAHASPSALSGAVALDKPFTEPEGLNQIIPLIYSGI